MSLVNESRLVVLIMLLLIIIAVVILISSIYKRYVPIKNIPCKNMELIDSSSQILDIRAYNQRRNNIKSDSVINIPYSYLERYNKEIPMVNLHVIASDKLELNLGVRYLLGKGIKVKSYEIMDCLCNERRLEHGVR